MTWLWIRHGANAEYERFDNIEDAADSVAPYTRPGQARWKMYVLTHANGVALPGFEEGDYVSTFWGDDDAQMSRGLNKPERRRFERALVDALSERAEAETA